MYPAGGRSSLKDNPYVAMKDLLGQNERNQKEPGSGTS